jgi:hypothetical protein
MSDNPLVAAARAELEACHPKNRAEECVLEAISDAINPPGGALPSPSTLDRLTEALPPESLVTPEAIRYAKIWTTLRSTLRCLGVEVASGRGKTVAVCVLNALYFGDELQEWHEDATARYRLCKLPQSSIDPSSPGLTSTPFTFPTSSHKPGNKAKQAQAISRRFQNDEKYSSDVSDPTTLAKTRERYMTAIDELEIDRSDQTAFLHHILKGAANDFFFTDISKRDPLPLLGEAFDMLEKRFETHEKQQQVRQSLTATTMDSLQRELSVSKRQALTEMYNRILRFTPSCPPETRGDRHMLILLCDALKSESWAEDTCSLRLSDGSITFATMYGKLAAILTDKLQKGSVSDSFQGGSPAMAYPVSFGQRFAQTPDPPKRKAGHYPAASWRSQTSPRRPIRNALPNDTCLRCKGKGHWAADCNSEGRLTMTDAIAARLRGADAEKAARVLFQFSQDFDAAESHREELAEEEATEQDVGEICNTFFALMSKSGTPNADTNDEDESPFPDFH